MEPAGPGASQSLDPGPGAPGLLGGDTELACRDPVDLLRHGDEGLGGVPRVPVATGVSGEAVGHAPEHVVVEHELARGIDALDPVVDEAPLPVGDQVAGAVRGVGDHLADAGRGLVAADPVGEEGATGIDAVDRRRGEAARDLLGDVDVAGGVAADLVARARDARRDQLGLEVGIHHGRLCGEHRRHQKERRGKPDHGSVPEGPR